MGSPEILQSPQPVSFTCNYFLGALPEACPCDESIILDKVLPDIASHAAARYTIEAVLNGLDRIHQDEATISVNAQCDGPRKSFFLRKPTGCGLETNVHIRTVFSSQNPTQ